MVARLLDAAIAIARVLLFLRVEGFDSSLVVLVTCALTMLEQEFSLALCRVKQRILDLRKLRVCLFLNLGWRHFGYGCRRVHIFGRSLLLLAER